jgi:hypothetical protein
MKYKIFGEWGFYPTSRVKDYTSAPLDQYAQFKVRNNLGTFNWALYWAPGNTWDYLDTYDNMWDSHGWAYGEASRYGSTSDDLDHHYNMNFRDSSGTWHLFDSLGCWQDSDPDYLWRRVSVTEFYIDQGVKYC